MPIRTATYIAMMGIVFSFVLTLASWVFQANLQYLLSPRFLFALAPTVCLHGSLLIFLYALYSKQSS